MRAIHAKIRMVASPRNRRTVILSSEALIRFSNPLSSS